MRVLFDTDVTLDLLFDRKPHSEKAALLFSKAERAEIEGFLCATTVTTLHYLAAKAIGEKKARRSLGKLLSFLDIAAVDRKVIENALAGKGPDFEDEVISQSAAGADARAIITRNIRNFKTSEVPAYSPEEFIRAMKI
jgi:predicted nucleic acid-binding protein